MTAKTAMKVRIEMAIPVDLTDMESLTWVTSRIEAMKDAARENGTLIAAHAKTGQFDFGDPMEANTGSA